MRTNKTLRIASVLLIAVLLTTCVIGTTLAKYTTTIQTQTATANVAKWEIKFDGTAVTDEAVTFNLFDTITEVGGGDDAEVADNVIAPGTAGTFKFKITNSSEVAAQTALTFTVTGNSVPIKFSVDGGEYGNDITVTGKKLTMGAEQEVTVDWKWEFTDDDETALAGTTVSVSAVINVEQVD